jgi:hypothetical protein
VAVRRKPRGYRQGGAVPDMPESVSAEGGEAPALEQSGPAPTDDDSPIKRQLEAIKRAERLQAEMAQRPAPTDMESQMSQAGLPDQAKAWMRTHPEYWTDRQKNSEINSLHGYLTNNKRIAPFSREYFDRLESELGIGAQPEPPRRVEPEPPRRSIPVGAPVTRGAPSMTSGAIPQRITLSPEQVMVARNSFTDPSLTNEAKEKMYAMNLGRMIAMRKAGTLNE